MRKIRYLLLGRLFPCAAALLLIFAAGAVLAIRLPQALAPISFGERLFSLLVGLFVISSAPENGKCSRLLLLLFLPWIGATVCLFLERARSERPHPCRPPFHGVAGAVSALSFSACGMAGGYAARAEYFRTGREMSVSLLADLEKAEREILLDYYILARGKFFDGVLQIMEKKAQNGVDVRLVYDDFGCAALLPKKFAKSLRARGIKAEVFHPLRPFPFARLNRRDHRKIAVIDGNIAYVGGINLADEYIGEKIRFGHWKDTALRVTGAPAGQLAAYYKGEEIPQSGAKAEIPCVLFADDATGQNRAGEEIYLRLIAAAEKKLFLCTPYLAPTARVLAALKSAARAGTDVRLMIPHIPDKKTVFLLTRAYARELEGAGVRIREYTAGFLHSKSLTADGKYALVGSYNLDGRSLRFQAENGAFIENDMIATEIEKDFLSMWETGEPVKKGRAWEKFLCFFLRPFSGVI